MVRQGSLLPGSRPMAAGTFLQDWVKQVWNPIEGPFAHYFDLAGVGVGVLVFTVFVIGLITLLFGLALGGAHGKESRDTHRSAQRGRSLVFGGLVTMVAVVIGGGLIVLILGFVA